MDACPKKQTVKRAGKIAFFVLTGGEAVLPKFLEDREKVHGPLSFWPVDPGIRAEFSSLEMRDCSRGPGHAAPLAGGLRLMQTSAEPVLGRNKPKTLSRWTL